MPSSSITISHYCRIKNNTISKDSQLLLRSEAALFQQFSDEAYRFCQINYPKFHKMDNLSKLAFLSAEFLLREYSLTKNYNPYRIGVILSNKSASLDTDYKYFNMVKKGVASPAVFVYSLPSIMLGEICIRNGIKGENTFFISDTYAVQDQVDYINNLFTSNVFDVCIGGWVELIEERYESFLFLVEKSTNNTNLAFTTKNIKNKYQDSING